MQFPADLKKEFVKIERNSTADSPKLLALYNKICNNKVAGGAAAAGIVFSRRSACSNIFTA